MLNLTCHMDVELLVYCNEEMSVTTTINDVFINENLSYQNVHWHAMYLRYFHLVFLQYIFDFGYDKPPAVVTS